MNWISYGRVGEFPCCEVASHICRAAGHIINGSRVVTRHSPKYFGKTKSFTFVEGCIALLNHATTSTVGLVGFYS